MAYTYPIYVRENKLFAKIVIGLCRFIAIRYSLALLVNFTNKNMMIPDEETVAMHKEKIESFLSTL